ncbi:MAG TPA: ATP-binding protein [Candidatus Competibacteraceae bacterium]|nr:GAF domain-containing protein [Candidatus Competibacteraceae bacterium]MCP5134533.1 GAF domain-containing protein [Gammaproteobacteria bacterium]HRY18519.1 ATP-binding protein [Candidatus Competibacteraceae bacterium]
MLPDPAPDPGVQCAGIQQVQRLYARIPLDAVVSLLIAPVLVFSVWNAIPSSVLLIWLVLLEVSVVIRLTLIFIFQRCPHPEDDATRWAVRYVWACLASGVSWGGAVLLLIYSPSLIYDVLIVLVLGGILMSGLLTLTPVLKAYLAYALSLSLPPALWLLWQSDPIHIVLGAASLLYLLLAVGIAHRGSQTLNQSLRLALRNKALIQSSLTAKEHAEKDHRQLAEQQIALMDSVEAMRELYRVISSSVRCAERMQAMLVMGCQRFGLATGILARIEGDCYEIVQVQSSSGAINQGDILDLGDTYCRDTLHAQGPLGFEHAAAGVQRYHPCYQKSRLEAYLGVSVWVNGSLYGTLNFSDRQPRATSFTTVDRELIQLMAQWIGGALEQERMAAASQRQQALLAHASRLNTLGEMASGLVHEINQPITAIMLYTDAGLARLRNPSFEWDELRETLEKIAAQSARAGAIIQQIRHFARRGKPQYVPVHVSDLFDEISDFLNLEAQRHAIRIRYDASPALPLVLADALQIQQVILNLARNAMDAMDARKGIFMILVSAHLDQGVVEIAVQDNGPGLEPGVLSQLLYPFFTTKPQGLGLGLPISQSIVEAHGGRLWVTSNPGSGVTFHFTLPVAGNADLPESAPIALSIETG